MIQCYLVSQALSAQGQRWDIRLSQLGHGLWRWPRQKWKSTLESPVPQGMPQPELLYLLNRAQPLILQLAPALPNWVIQGILLLTARRKSFRWTSKAWDFHPGGWRTQDVFWANSQGWNNRWISSAYPVSICSRLPAFSMNKWSSEQRCWNPKTDRESFGWEKGVFCDLFTCCINKRVYHGLQLLEIK